MQAGVGLLVTDVMPLYMTMPRYSHNYSLFYQLLDSNLFTHHNTYAILREATSETYGPRVYFTSYKFPIYNSSLLFILQSPAATPPAPTISIDAFVAGLLSTPPLEDQA